MDLKKLEKATKIYNDLKEIDQEIKDINDFALKMANENFKINLKFEFISINKPNIDKISFDEDGSLVIRNMGESTSTISLGTFLFGGHVSKDKESLNRNEDQFETLINDSTLLNILALLLSEKEKKKTVLVESLIKMGVKFK